MRDVIIIGSGPAGLSAAIYAKRACLDTLVIEKQPMSGGQILNTYEVDNYPGMPEMNGFEMGQKFREHADKLGVEFLTADVIEVSDEEGIKCVTTLQETLQSKSLILATGAAYRKLEVPGEGEFGGKGVSYCATCDGAFFRGKSVAVVGGGDVALEDALFLAKGSETVYLIHRRDAFRGAKVLEERVRQTKNIQIIWDTVVERINGSEIVESISIYNKKEEKREELIVNGIFIAVGIIPNTDVIKNFVEMDSNGYVKAGEDCVTSKKGVFAAGDIRTKPLRQVITAAADGANAVTSLEHYLFTE